MFRWPPTVPRPDRAVLRFFSTSFSQWWRSPFGRTHEDQMIARRSHGRWFRQVSFCSLTQSSCLLLRAISAIGRTPNTAEDPSASCYCGIACNHVRPFVHDLEVPTARTKGNAPKSLLLERKSSSFPRVLSSLGGRHVEMYPAVSRNAGVNISRFSKVRGIGTAVRRRLARLRRSAPSLGVTAWRSRIRQQVGQTLSHCCCCGLVARDHLRPHCSQ